MRSLNTELLAGDLEGRPGLEAPATARREDVDGDLEEEEEVEAEAEADLPLVEVFVLCVAGGREVVAPRRERALGRAGDSRGTLSAFRTKPDCHYKKNRR